MKHEQLDKLLKRIAAGYTDPYLCAQDARKAAEVIVTLRKYMHPCIDCRGQYDGCLGYSDCASLKDVERVLNEFPYHTIED